MCYSSRGVCLRAAFEKAPPEVQEILGKPIRDLGLKLEGSPLERFVQQLYRELDRKGLKKFRPACYLTDEWGCPSGEPIIGIPFYLADPKLARLEKEMNADDGLAGRASPFVGEVACGTEFLQPFAVKFTI